MKRLHALAAFRRLFKVTTANRTPHQPSHRGRRKRLLRTERLENRQLLAGDTDMFRHNVFDAEDVNDDGQVSSIDALAVINALNRRDPIDETMFSDVNNDGIRNPLDALRVINRLNRSGSDIRQGNGGQGGDGSNGHSIPERPAEVRSVDGTGNNLENPSLGAVGSNYLQIAEPEYGDGISTAAGANRPSAREISNLLSTIDGNGTTSDRDLSAFLYVWGQFIDHDMDLTLSQDDGESLDIVVPTGDLYFDPTSSGESSIPFSRSVYDPATGDSVSNPRQQVNAITSYIDGSMVYGSDQVTADSLRSFENGLMLTSASGLLPTNDQGQVQAGDIRAAENPSLTALQTLFVREHNRLAAEIAAQDPSSSDEEIYQQARAIVVSQIQAITYNEFLPALLGNRAMSRYQGYDASVNPTISSEFATAAFRFGHSTLNDDVGFFDNNGRDIRDEMELRDAFFQSSILEETGIDAVLKYDASSLSMEIDLEVVDGLRNFLFGPPGAGGFDLVALNIQRGRDHGLADYNATREAFGLDPIESFADITSNEDLQEKLEFLYENVNNVDLWVGLMAEDHVRGASVGELTQAIIVDQFDRLRSGDRLWYENVFHARELRQMQETSLSDVIERNTEIDNLQDNVFFMRAQISGRVTATISADANNSTFDREDRGDRDRSRTGVEGVVVELRDDEGNVLATTETDSRGNYRFDEFGETGDYSVRVLSTDSVNVVSDETLGFLVSNGSTRLRGLDFQVET